MEVIDDIDKSNLEVCKPDGRGSRENGNRELDTMNIDNSRSFTVKNSKEIE